MNVDEAMELFGPSKKKFWTLQSGDHFSAGETLACEVERLRAELAQSRKDWCDDDEAIKQQALRVLDAAKVEGDSVYVPRMGALAEMMADEMVKVRAELTVEREAFKLLGNLRAEVLTKLAEAKAEYVGLAESHYRVEAELAAAKAELEKLVTETIKRNGWGAE